MSTIDWTAPLEAYHPDGRVVEVEWDGDDYGGYYQLTEYLPDGNIMFSANGTHSIGDWRIRNRKKPEAPALPVTVELWERVKALLARMNADFGVWCNEDAEAAYTEARAIFAALNPPEVDPLERKVADLLCESDPESSDEEWSYLPQAKALLAAAPRFGLTITKADAGEVK